MPSPDEPISIREYRPADFDAICEIDRQCFSREIAYSPQEMALGLLQRGAFALLAEQGGSIIGFILAYQKKDVGHIVTIDLLPDVRRKGLGQQLMQRVEERLQRRGAVRVILEVSVKNEAAIRFYKYLGYVARRWLQNYYPDGSDAWLMEKRIASGE